MSAAAEGMGIMGKLDNIKSAVDLTKVVIDAGIALEWAEKELTK